jgi:broad specificity phosphatase PhoE
VRLILIRHGQTPCNLRDMWHGWDDCELTEAGRRQADSLAARLVDEPIVAVHSSDSRRAVQTAEAIARTRGLTPIPDPAFRERFAGDFEGLSTERVVALRPTVWDDRAADYWGWSPPGGETFRQVLDRTLAGVDRMRASYPCDTVALVGHMGTSRVLVSHLLDIPLSKTYEMEFRSTGVSILRFEPEGIEVEALNDGAHVG